MTVFEDMQRVKALADEINPRRYITTGEVEGAMKYAAERHDFRMTAIAEALTAGDQAHAGRLVDAIVADHREGC